MSKKAKTVIYECAGCGNLIRAKSNKFRHRPSGYWLGIYHVTEPGHKHSATDGELYACDKQCAEDIVQFKMGQYLR